MLPRTWIAIACVATCATTNAFVSQSLSRRAASSDLAFVRSTTSALHMKYGGATEEWELPEDRSQLSDSRRERMQIEATAKSRFVSGDQLHLLRKEVLDMREDLSYARRHSSAQRIQELERAILQAQQVDAEFVYAVALERMEVAESTGDHEAVEKYRAEAMAARSCLPQFNLEGLWVGKYGDHGYEMINVTYIGDTLVAHKVTGAKNVPKGQPTFQVDLNPNAVSPNNILKPIELTEDATKQWGTKHLARYAGIGHVSGEGFVNSQWMDGQLILVGEYFSFAWLPLGHQVFFGRPSPELTLKMLKENNKAKSSSDKLRRHLERCMDETEHLQDETEVSSGLAFSVRQHEYFDQEGCFE